MNPVSCTFEEIQLPGRSITHTGGEDHNPDPHSEEEFGALLSDAGREQSLALERIMLLGDDDVVEAAHQLKAIVAELVWRSRGEVNDSVAGRTVHQPGVFL
ncbi:hypothetical protein JMUB6875_76830 [Nocardia sp. JMUB6875]|uniref:hypothetical protein n=1 Tax=Nocardia sp. JMUB6875 TaxID=3158170 RepID=UPI0032E6DC03